MEELARKLVELEKRLPDRDEVDPFLAMTETGILSSPD